MFANPDIQERIFTICDIELVHGDEPAGWITIDGGTDFTVIARDGSGGLFLLTVSPPRVVYASSEGEAGVVADDIDALMAVLVWCPWWQGLLKYSAGGRIEEMRRAAPFMESSWMGDEEEHAVARAYLIARLGIAEPPDLLGALHRAVSMPLDARFNDQAAQSLFGRFTIDDNPFFRMQKA